MKKHNLFPYLTLGIFLLLGAVLYLFWEKGGADLLTEAVKPPVTVTPIRVGTPAPDFSVPGNRVWSKQAFQLQSHAGKPIVLHFWATWCGPCLLELPEILQLVEKRKDIVFVTVAIDDSWATIEKFFLQYPALASIKDRTILLLDPESEIADRYASNKFPETFLINSQGIIDNKFVGAQPWISPAMSPYLDHL